METKELQVKKDLPANHENPANLISLAIEKGATIETIERLMALEERWRANKAKELYSKDFVNMKPQLPAVARTKNNAQTKSKYAPLEDINKLVDPILSKHGFATATKITAQTADSVTVEAELWHNGGHVERTSITLPLDDKGMQGTVNKTKIHGTASTVTYGKRIAICALLNISTGDDTDGNKPPVEPSKEQMTQSMKRLADLKKDVQKLKTATEIQVNAKDFGEKADKELLPFHAKELKDFIKKLYNEKKNETGNTSVKA